MPPTTNIEREQKLEALADKFLDLLTDLVSGRRFITFSTSTVGEGVLRQTVTTVDVVDNSAFTESQ